MRTLWLTENYFPDQGGMAQSCDRIVNGLRSRGWQLDVAHLSRKSSRFHREQKLMGADLTCPVGKDVSHSMQRLWNEIQKVHHQTPYTHLVCFGGHLPLLGGPVFSAWLNIPVITLLRGNDFDTAVFDAKRRPVLTEAMMCSRSVCTVSREKTSKVSSLFPGKQVHWVANGIDLSQWRAIKSERDTARRWRSRSVPEGKQVLGFFGHLKAKKGTLFFLECLLASGLTQHFFLLFVGTLDPAIEARLAQNPDISYHQYEFLDRYDLIKYYLGCDYSVIASFYDGLPNVALESAALGVPLICSTAGGLGDFFENDRHGFTFYPGDHQSCRLAIQNAHEAGERRKDLARRCSQLAVDHFSHDREIEKYIEIIYEKTTNSPALENRLA